MPILFYASLPTKLIFSSFNIALTFPNWILCSRIEAKMSLPYFQLSSQYAVEVLGLSRCLGNMDAWAREQQTTKQQSQL
jgi:hypothetical protein